MKWNYRIVRYADGRGFGLHEVYCDDNGAERTMTIDPVRFAVDGDEGPDAILQDLRAALEDAARYEVLDETALRTAKQET